MYSHICIHILTYIYVYIYNTERKPSNCFLKLADDRGWIFERHPKTRGHLIVPVGGQYETQDFHCTYKADKGPDLDVCFGPSRQCRQTGHTIQPGLSVNVVASFKLEAGATPGIAFPAGGAVEFLKLKDGGGWIPSRSEQGEELLERSETRQNPLFQLRRGSAFI
jgi:hypothetical protein